MDGADIRWITRWRNRLRAVLKRDAVESELDNELAYHLELEIEENLRSGMTPAEARRQAAIAFGGMEKHKEGVRNARAFGWLPGASLDLKLAWRMLIKSPALTVVGGLGIAVAVAIGTLFFSIQDMIFHSTLPFEDGDRVVALEVQDTDGNEPERRILHELVLWRQELRSVQEIGAWRSIARTLVVPGGDAGPVPMAEMSASGFRIARVPALLGRTLLEEDELAAAPAVAVIGSGVWRSYFNGDPDVVGREIRLGTTPFTVVGVMPEGFAFPVNQELWVPLRVDPEPAAPRSGPAVSVFGRLAPGATMKSAAAEFAALGQRMTADYPDTRVRLRTHLVPYTQQGLDVEVSVALGIAQTVIILLLVVICTNIAVLVHARTAARTGEIAMRSALGASRRRIVGQLFAEALALTLGAALAGVVIAALVLEWAANFLGQQGPLSFWMQLRLSPAAVLYALALAAGGAAIVGVIPALKATGRSLRSGIDRSGGARLRLGRMWTVLVVVQVAIATAILPAATFGAWEQFRSGLARTQFPAAEFLTAGLYMESDTAGNQGGQAAEVERAARFDDRVGELTARLEAEPSVARVTFERQSVGNSIPGTVVIEDLPRAPDEPTTSPVRALEVDLALFDAFGMPVLEGRGFRPGDLAEGATAVVVNRAFVEEVLGGRNAVGREMRYATLRLLGSQIDTTRRYQIVGVVGNQLVVPEDPWEADAHVYHPTTAGRLGSVNLVVRMRGRTPTDFAPRFREITAALDPTLQLREIRPMDELLRMTQQIYSLGGAAIAAVTLSVVLLSAAGIHALMSFTTTRRRREIGIRSALGARPARLLAGVFSRAAGQIAIGLAVGLGGAALINRIVESLIGEQAAIFTLAPAALMAVVGLLAAFGPARRGLRVQPMEALRTE